MSNLTIPNNIANGLSADGDLLGANLDAIQAWADAHVVEKAGATLTGALVLAADPVLALGASTKQYVDKIGLVGSATTATDQTISTQADITGVSVTWTADPTRTYRTTLQIGAVNQSATGGQQLAYITDGSNNLIRTTSTQAAASARASHCVTVIESGLSGSVTRKARFATSGGTGTLLAAVGSGATSFAPTLTVEDIGSV